jgi:integrase
VLAILHMALKEKAPELRRPKGHKDVRPVIIPPEEWYRAIAPALDPTKLAFVMLLAMHGRRTNEMLSRKPQHLDMVAGLMDLGKTKTGIRELVINPKCLALLEAMEGWRERKWLFGCGPNSANSFRRDLKAAILKTGQPWYTPHSFGRHMSVTRMLRAGYSVAHVADAHGMTAAMVLTRYGHLAKKETTAALHKVGGELFDRTFSGGNVGDDNGDVTGGLAPIGLVALENMSVSAAPELLPSEGDTLSS